MFFADLLTLDAPTRTSEGFLRGRARVARTGLYDYAGREVDPENKRGLRDKAVVKIFRPGDEVFDRASLASFVGKPITNDHPRGSVTADNWRQHARGTIMGAVRDGEYVGFDYLITDGATIKAIDDGKKELSNGYGCDLDFTPGVHDGVAYDAVQRGIRGNHLAIVDRGRAGSQCRISDSAECDALPQQFLDWLADQRTYDGGDGSDNSSGDRSDANRSLDGGSHVATKTMTFDGLPLEVTDAAEAAINKLLGQLKDAVSAKDAAETGLATVKTEMAAKDAEIVTLKQSVEDAKTTPAQLRDAAKAYALVCDKAKALGVTFAEDADADAIMRAVVDAKMGDTAKTYDAKEVSAAFAVLTKDAKVAQPDPLRDAISSGVTIPVVDADKQVTDARAAMIADLKGEKPAKAA